MIDDGLTYLAKRRCDNKALFLQEGRAMDRAVEIFEECGIHLVAYQCPDCGAFHLGHHDGGIFHD